MKPFSDLDEESVQVANEYFEYIEEKLEQPPAN